jgi:hypothetical protein
VNIESLVSSVSLVSAVLLVSSYWENSAAQPVIEAIIKMMISTARTSVPMIPFQIKYSCIIVHTEVEMDMLTSKAKDDKKVNPPHDRNSPNKINGNMSSLACSQTDSLEAKKNAAHSAQLLHLYTKWNNEPVHATKAV